ncbi:conserved hypothetical protein [Crenothrix polyspora]|uniref:Uncharacterized protein n=1 Tax=Crenothrix polyspora TaxID=360316 RepID=A0A1R4H090_9GAMM|nr:hypothetical protein [Crenothrix polyspora]SJM89635.1 conserved hypothetical protein [Crenothrix polyspora]
MSLIILQIIIKQWDKSQRTPAHVLQRAAIANQQPIYVPPAVYVLDNRCVIDQHGDDIQGGRVKYPKVVDRAISFDRFRINLDNKNLAYCGSKANEAPITLGSINNQWIQCKYNGRYSVFESELYYWLYEEVTLNTIWLDQFDDSVFLNTEPVIVYEDFNDLDTLRK